MFALALLLAAAAPTAPQLAILGQQLQFFTAGPPHQRALVAIPLEQTPETLSVAADGRQGAGARWLKATVEIR